MRIFRNSVEIVLGSVLQKTTFEESYNLIKKLAKFHGRTQDGRGEVYEFRKQDGMKANVLVIVDLKEKNYHLIDERKIGKKRYSEIRKSILGGSHD